MKKVGLVLLAMMLIMSCDEDDIAELLPSMSATIDGTDWSASIRSTVSTDDVIVITGTSTVGEVIAVTVLGTSEGTYELSLTDQECSALYKATVNASTDDTYVSATGTVVITELDTSSKKVSGTFSFTMLQGLSTTMTISEGEFSNLSYTEQ